jgi:hypothetical protein
VSEFEVGEVLLELKSALRGIRAKLLVHNRPGEAYVRPGEDQAEGETVLSVEPAMHLGEESLEARCLIVISLLCFLISEAMGIALEVSSTWQEAGRMTLGCQLLCQLTDGRVMMANFFKELKS